MFEATQIIPGLYLGNVHDALNDEQLERHEITAKVSAAAGVNTQSDSLDYLQVNMIDIDSFDILADLPTVLAFLHSRLSSKKNVLVHCMHGRSRSVSIVLAYLMVHADMTLEAAWTHVKRVRPQVRPNEGFMAQLRQLETSKRTNK